MPMSSYHNDHLDFQKVLQLIVDPLYSLIQLEYRKNPLFFHQAK